MRWLLVAHHLPPRHRAGVEVHTLALAHALRDSGEEVQLFATDDDPLLPPFSLRTEELEGIPVHWLAHPRIASDLRATLGGPREASAFEEVLRRTRPEIVHFHHLMYVGLDAPRLARAAGAVTLLTLHEYWMLCGRNGQLIRADESLCSRAELNACSTCLASHRFGRGRLEWRIAQASAQLSAWSGWDSFTLLKSLQSWRKQPLLQGAQGKLDTALVQERRTRMGEALGAMQRILCPSEFLKSQFLLEFREFEHRFLHWPNGVPENPCNGAGLRGKRRAGGAALRVGFMGTLTPLKGADVLLRAVGTLPPHAVRLVLFGSLSHDPAYVAGLKGLATEETTFAGPYAGSASAALAGLDVLVVPSRWYENAPLVISEAFAAGVPVVCSDIGGMRELVRHDVDGLHFKMGDPCSLAEQLTRLLEESELLARLRCGISAPRTITAEARETKALAESILLESRT
jgi:glycosyltransferase involved in cell wall biosynthesis